MFLLDWFWFCFFFFFIIIFLSPVRRTVFILVDADGKVDYFASWTLEQMAALIFATCCTLADLASTRFADIGYLEIEIG